MDTMKALDWAFNLRGISPDSKLAAVYVATLTGMSGSVVINTSDAAVWCGFISAVLQEPRPWRFVGALQELTDLHVKEMADSVVVTWRTKS